ncbi:MAG: thioredoxin domain-containing protein [Myxococcota bacterium]|nr:thioredoxin domain-containing protein [Myxococcota bacterium]
MMIVQLIVPLAILATASLPNTPDPTALAPQQRATFESVVSEEFCSCSSPLTLGSCLKTKPECGTSRHLGDVVFKAVQAGNTSSEILRYLAERVTGPFCAKQREISLKDAPAKGAKEAEITVVEFADFRCGHCKDAVPIIEAAYRKLGKSVKFIFAPFPLGDHPESIAAARASMAAADQGAFWKYHDALFETQDKGFAKARLFKLATKLGLNLKKFKTVYNAQSTLDIIKSFKTAGLNAGVTGTPAFFVNGRKFDPDEAIMTFTKRVAMERSRQRGPCQ